MLHCSTKEHYRRHKNSYFKKKKNSKNLIQSDQQDQQDQSTDPKTDYFNYDEEFPQLEAASTNIHSNVIPQNEKDVVKSTNLSECTKSNDLKLTIVKKINSTDEHHNRWVNIASKVALKLSNSSNPIVNISTIDTYSNTSTDWHDILKPNSNIHMNNQSLNYINEKILVDERCISQDVSTIDWWTSVLLGDHKNIRNYVKFINWDITLQLTSLTIEERNILSSILSKKKKQRNKSSVIRLDDIDGFCCLHILCIFGDSSTLATIIDKIGNLNLDIRCKSKITPLHMACEYASIECFDILIQNHASYDLRDKLGETILHKAVRSRRLKFISYITSKINKFPGLKLNSKNKSNETALMLCSSIDIVLKLLAIGCDPSIRGAGGYDSFCLACKLGDEELLEAYILSNNSNVFHRNSIGYFHPINNISSFITPLHVACQFGNIACVRILMKYDYYDINSQVIPTLQTPISLACEYGHVDILEELLNIHKDILINSLVEDSKGLIPIVHAAIHGHFNCVLLLLKTSLSIFRNHRNNFGETIVECTLRVLDESLKPKDEYQDFEMMMKSNVINRTDKVFDILYSLALLIHMTSSQPLSDKFICRLLHKKHYKTYQDIQRQSSNIRNYTQIYRLLPKHAVDTNTNTNTCTSSMINDSYKDVIIYCHDNCIIYTYSLFLSNDIYFLKLFTYYNNTYIYTKPDKQRNEKYIIHFENYKEETIMKYIQWMSYSQEYKYYSYDSKDMTIAIHIPIVIEEVIELIQFCDEVMNESLKTVLECQFAFMINEYDMNSPNQYQDVCNIFQLNSIQQLQEYFRKEDLHFIDLKSFNELERRLNHIWNTRIVSFHANHILALGLIDDVDANKLPLEYLDNNVDLWLIWYEKYIQENPNDSLIAFMIPQSIVNHKYRLQLFNNSKNYDIKILCHIQSINIIQVIYCHHSLLISNSQVFEALIRFSKQKDHTSNMKDEIHIDLVDTYHFMLIYITIRFFYVSQLLSFTLFQYFHEKLFNNIETLSPDMTMNDILQNLLELSDEYIIPSLKCFIETILISQLAPDNMISYLQISNLFQDLHHLQFVASLYYLEFIHKLVSKRSKDAEVTISGIEIEEEIMTVMKLIYYLFC